MVLNWAQGLKEKSHEVSARKNNNRVRYNKKCRGGADSALPPPALLGLMQKWYASNSCASSPKPCSNTKMAMVQIESIEGNFRLKLDKLLVKWITMGKFIWSAEVALNVGWENYCAPFIEILQEKWLVEVMLFQK